MRTSSPAALPTRWPTSPHRRTCPTRWRHPPTRPRKRHSGRLGRRVRGDALDDPESRLPAIDRLEGFRPGGSSLYRRVLVPATVSGARELAWVYTVETIRIKRRRIVSGRWPQ